MYIHFENIDMQKTIRKISTIGPGKTYYITLPRQMLRELKWRKGQKKIIFREGNKLIIVDWVPE
jgi:bifunctional DNA-binding transcriptional regulator/antitoxin component of YhaV-PrlF toxin-antitoxin module